MLKLTIIGAVMVAATSAGTFQNKFAQKFQSVYPPVPTPSPSPPTPTPSPATPTPSPPTPAPSPAPCSNSTAPPCPGEILEEWIDALDRSNVTTPEEYLEDLQDYFQNQTDQGQDALVDELIECYDVDGDGYLSRDEFDTYVTNTLTGVTRCPTQPVPTAGNLTSAQQSTLISWITNSTRTNWQSLTQIYSSVPGTFDRSDFNDAIMGRSKLVFIGRTPNGIVFGGYTGNSYIPSYETTSWIGGTDMFIFNLNSNTRHMTSYSSMNIWISTYSSYSDLIDFGWHNALQFEVNSDMEVTASYIDSYYYDFNTYPYGHMFGLSSSDLILDSFEVYQVVL